MHARTRGLLYWATPLRPASSGPPSHAGGREPERCCCKGVLAEPAASPRTNRWRPRGAQCRLTASLAARTVVHATVQCIRADCHAANRIGGCRHAKFSALPPLLNPTHTWQRQKLLMIRSNSRKRNRPFCPCVRAASQPAWGSTSSSSSCWFCTLPVVAHTGGARCFTCFNHRCARARAARAAAGSHSAVCLHTTG